MFVALNTRSDTEFGYTAVRLPNGHGKILSSDIKGSEPRR